MRLTDLLLTLPVLAVVLVAAAFLHVDTAQKAAIVIACLVWTSVARVLRASSLALREKEFVDCRARLGSERWAHHPAPHPSQRGGASRGSGIADDLDGDRARGDDRLPGFGFSNLAGLQAKPSIGDVLRQAQSEGYYHWWGSRFPACRSSSSSWRSAFSPRDCVTASIHFGFEPAFLGKGISASPRRRRRLAPALRKRAPQVRVPEWVTLERVRQVLDRGGPFRPSFEKVPALRTAALAAARS